MKIPTHFLLLFLTALCCPFDESVGETMAKINGPIPDGTPPSPAPAKPVWTVPNTDVIAERTHTEGGRTITVREIQPIDLPPPPQAKEPLPISEALQERIAQHRQQHPAIAITSLSATVYYLKDPENSESHLTRTYLTFWRNGHGTPITFWSSGDFSLLSGIGSFTGNDGVSRSLFMMWSTIDTRRLTGIRHAQGKTYQLPEIPDLPSGNADFVLSDGESDAEIRTTIQSLHEILNRDEEALRTARESRVRAAKEREEFLKANPKPPRDVILNHWRIKSPEEGGSKHLLIPSAWILLAGTVNAQIDANENGMSDIWELNFNDYQLFSPSFLPGDDEDGDGQTNLSESIAGTNPLHFNPPDGHFGQTIRHVPATWFNDPEEAEPILSTPEAYEIDWHGQLGKKYTLVATTDPSAPSWLPVGDPVFGYGYPITLGVLPAYLSGDLPEAFFWRVQAEDLDSDGDSLTDYEEALLGTKADNSATLSGLPDLWVATHFAARILEFGLAAYDPNVDSDGDGITDLEEFLGKTNPNLVTPADPAASGQQWLAVLGNGAEDIPVTRTRQFSIPAGKTAILIVAIASDEYDLWTDPATSEEFNDILEWEIKPTALDTIEGTTNVNDRHVDWQLAELAGHTLSGLPGPVHIEEFEVLKAPPNAPLTVDVEISATNIGDELLPSHLVVGLLPTDLKIWNSQDATNPVPEDKKQSVGGFTVANLNDTDGDGTIDEDDNDVPGEKDLMKLYVGGYAGLQGKVKLTVKSGNDRVKFWETKEKKTAIPLDANGAVLFDVPAGGLDKTLWIEAIAPSGIMRDIEIWAGHQDALGDLHDGIDKVKATAIWVIHKETKNKADDAMWNDASQELKDKVVTDEVTPFGESFDRQIMAGQQSIGFKFEVFPHDIASEASVRFDVTRQANYQYWKRNEANVFVDADNEPWPAGDLANDDVNNEDEDNIPENNYLFSIDSPGFPFNTIAPEPVAQQNFREFVRVWFKEDELMGNNSDGSRCSDKYDWHSFYWWVQTPSAQNPEFNAYKRKPGAPASSNEIGPGHGTIAQPTP